MSLVGHIVLKDLQRFLLPLLFWLVLVLVPMFPLLASPGLEGHVANHINAMTDGLRIWIRGTEFIVALFGYLLAGSLILEDSIVGTTEFWKTRPIAGVRLLAAKVLGAILLLIVPPLIALSVVWLANGFTADDWAIAARHFAGDQGRLVLLALAVASLSRTLAQFVFVTLLLAGAGGACVAIPAALGEIVPTPVQMSRELLSLSAIPLSVGVVLVHQFLTRRVARAWVIVTVVFAGCLLIRLAWPWDVVSASMAAEHRARFAPRPEDRTAQVVMEPTFRASRRGEFGGLYGTTAWAPAGFYAPTLARTPDGVVALRTTGEWETTAGLRALALEHETGAMRCQLLGPAPRGSEANDEDLRFTGILEIWLVRPRILGEVPLRMGAQLQIGASRTRILFLGRNEDNQLSEIIIEERNSHAAAAGRWRANRPPDDAQRSPYIDRYFLINRAKAQGLPLESTELGSSEMNGIVMQYRRLNLSGEGEWGDAALVKLRLECDHRFEQPLEVRGIRYGQLPVQP